MTAERDVRYAGYERHRTPDGVELAYRVQGEGPTIAIVNSVLESSTAWRAFTHHAKRRYRLIAYDLRNQGRSASAPPAFRSHVADLRSLLDALEVDEAFLLGHSIGTQICVAFAEAHPDAVRGLILVGPMVNPSGAERRRRLVRAWSAVLEAGGAGALFDVFWPQIIADGSFARHGPGGYDAYRELWTATTPVEQLRAHMRSSLEAQEQVPALDAIEQPVLLLTGEDDFIGTQGALRETAAIIPHATVRRLPDVGHVPHLESPQAFEDEIDAFVDGVLGADRLAPAAGPVRAEDT